MSEFTLEKVMKEIYPKFARIHKTLNEDHDVLGAELGLDYLSVYLNEVVVYLQDKEGTEIHFDKITGGSKHEV